MTITLGHVPLTCGRSVLMRTKHFAYALFLLVTCAAVFGQQQEIDAHNHATKLRDDYLDWTSESTPGMQLTPREVARESKPGGTWITYELFTSGLPKEINYDLITEAVGEKPGTMLIGMSVDKDGRLYCAGREAGQCKSRDKKDVPVRIIVISVPGKPFRFAVSNNMNRFQPGAIFVPIVMIPEPIESSDGHCSINAIRLTQQFEVAYLTLDGFKPNSRIEFDGVSYGEKHGGTLMSDSKGSASLLLLPFVLGHASGTTKLGITGSGCAQDIEFPWGDQTPPATANKP